jgi:acetate kinase
MGKEGLSLSEAGTLLNKHSGLQGISGISSDMREIIAEMKNGDKKATYAFDVFTYRVKKYIGAYAAAMGGVDAIVFTGGIGENSAEVRQASCAGLDFLGITVNAETNESSERQKDISVKGSKTRVLVIPTNEELVIALDTMEIVKARSAAQAAS